MKLKVGCVKYINALPLYFPFTSKGVEFVYDIPSKLNSQLEKKELDGALTSSVESLNGKYQCPLDFGIVACNKVLSVNLYTQLPPSSLNGMRVGLTQQSATSISLLKVLCHHHWKIKPLFVPLEGPFSSYAAVLLIGDEALENQTLPGFQTIDLAEVWYAMTGLPFVFALFAMQPEIKLETLKSFNKELTSALQWSDSHPTEIQQEALKRCRLSPSLVKRYYSTLSYRIGQEERKSLDLFRMLRTHVS